MPKETSYIKRRAETQILQDLREKMVLVGGPRRCGKTTLARRMCRARHKTDDERYFNWDIARHREKIIAEQFAPLSGMIVLDEIHKYTRWRQVLKGLYDLHGNRLAVLVTGSGRLDQYRRGGDSLQGRYHYHRLLPFTFDETGGASKADLNALLRYGWFPEQFVKASDRHTLRWGREYRSRLVQEDVRDLERVTDLGLIEKLYLHLPETVGSPFSLNSLREDLQVAHTTVARWVDILERLYAVFRIYPFGHTGLRAVKKEPKLYLTDFTSVHDEGARFENLIALHLLAWCFHRQDTEGRDIELRYFRDTDRREVDFVVTERRRALHFVECKLSDRTVSPSLRYLKQRTPAAPCTQIVMNFDDEVIGRDGIRLCAAHRFLRDPDNLQPKSH
jgi:predicted AAA+ superfamily ATPase